ncbi:MAG: carbohydrate ABC transporter permease [Aggregatilineales bacterium]
MQRRGRFTVSLSAVFLMIFTVIFFLPVIHGLSRSVSPPNGIDNYLRVLQDQRLPRYFINSVIVSGGIIGLTMFSSTLAGYAFSKLEFPFKNVLFYVLLITLLVPFSTLIVPLFLLVRGLGLYNSYLGLILPQAAFAVPFFTV